MAPPESIRILLVEDNPGDARLAREVLTEVGGERFDIEHVDHLAAALDRLGAAHFDVVLLDLSLPDARGLETVVRVQLHCPGVPIVVLSGMADEEVALEAVQKGAQDYLAKGASSPETMARAIRYAIERKRGQQLLLEEKEKVELANRAKDQFLATMSHELRTPLNAIIGFAEAIMKEMLGPLDHPTYKQYVADIHTSGMHLLEIINDILDLAKIDAGTARLHEESIDVAEVVHTSLRMIEPRASEARVTTAAALDDHMPPLWADKRQLCQILVNLLSNAVKFTPAGGQVAVAAEVEPGGALALAVSDTGIGIAPEDIPKAMALFGQVDGSLSRRYPGTGLGLPLVKRLVELHGGTMALESEVGTGTTVTVRFPPHRVMAPQVAAAAR